MIYMKALKHFNVSPEDTLFVGDNWKNDVLGPTELGIKAVWLNIDKKPIPDHARVYGVVNKLIEIKQFVSKSGR